jgi:spore germination protein
VLLLVDGWDRGLTIADKGYPGKAVGNCESEKVLRGSSEGFCDSVKTNEALVRKRIRSTGLKILEKKVGLRSETTVAILYMAELAQPEFLEQLTAGLEHYSMDGVFDGGTLEQLMEKDWASPFPQFQSTQRPDRAAMELLEGRVVLLCDNSPTALLLPAVFDDFFRVSEDKYNHFELVTFQRIIRYGAMAAAIYISAFYLAVINFHTQLVPTALLLSLAEARQGVPFPPLIEVLLMELSFEMIREAGVRMPGPLSGTIGIVGGLIIGDAAVSANLVSPMSVIVVAFSALCTFAVPDEEFGGGLRIVKLLMIFLGGFLGLGGIVGGSFWLLLHLGGLESFGIPYMQIRHRKDRQQENRILRQPAHRLRYRPYYVPEDQAVRLKKNTREGNNHE